MPDEQTTQTPPATTEVAPVPPVAQPSAATEQTPQAPQQQAAPPAPLTLESIKLPEGIKTDDPLVKEYVEVQNDAKLSPVDRANKLLDLYGRATKAASEQGSKAWADLQTQWQNEIKSDPEVGGVKLAESQKAVGRVLDQFGDDEVRKAFDYTGAGNNPAIFKFLTKMGALVKEGDPKLGTPASPPKTLAEILYPNQGKT